MPSYVIYARKSTESEDRQVLSIQSQVEELRKIASSRGIPVSDVLTETKSAKAPGRRVFGELMRRVQKGEIHGTLAWKMDRLSRNHLDTGTILQALADGKLTEIITSDRTYTRDGNDRFIGNFELGMATKYIDDLSQNVRRGNRARFERGWVNHNPPLGYLIDPGTKTIIKDPNRFDLVRRMWELVLTNTMRPIEVVKTANDKWGLRTRRYKRIGGKPLAPSTFYRILSNPFYMGTICLQSGKTYVGAHPQMVTGGEFARVQEILGRPGRPRPKRHSFPFTGIIRCGGCGSAVTAEKHVKPSGRRYVYYRCSRPKLGPPCREPAVPAPILNEQLSRELRRMTMPGAVQAFLTKRVSRVLEQELSQREAAKLSVEKALAATRREAENLVSLKIRDMVPDVSYERLQGQLAKRERALQDQLQRPNRSVGELKRLMHKALDFSQDAPRVFEMGTAVQRREILEAVGLNYTLKSGKVRLSYRKPFRRLSEAGALCNWSGIPEDVRTFFETTTEYFHIPDLSEAA